MAPVASPAALQANVATGEAIDVDAWWSKSTELGRKRKQANRGGTRLERNDLELLIREHGGT